MAKKFIDDDFVVVRKETRGAADVKTKLAFGDEVEVLGEQGGCIASSRHTLKCAFGA